MIAFLDTSALVKLYHWETGSDIIEKAICDATELYLSEIAKLEFRSAIYKKVRTKDLNLSDAESVIACFEADYTQFNWINVDKSVIQSASELLTKYGEIGLRTLDSIQLASALSVEIKDCLILSADIIINKIVALGNLP